MCLHPRYSSEIPPEIAEWGREFLADDNPYRLIGDQLHDLISDDDFVDLYSSIGGAALSPTILALVTVFQMMEKLPDRAAALAVMVRLDWKYALHLPLAWKGFHFTNLSHFRLRLIEHEAEYLVFDRLVSKLVDMGFVRRRGPQRTDSTKILGQVAKLSRLEMVWETMRVTVRTLVEADTVWSQGTLPEAFRQEYQVAQHSYQLSQAEVTAALRRVGADGFWLLQRVDQGPSALQALSEVGTMRAVWDQQFELDEQGQYRRPRTKVDPHGLIQSPHEPEVRYRQKRGEGWQGYVAQVTETAEEKGEPNFITDVAATDAQVSDVNALPEIQARLAERDVSPEEQYVDQAYVSGTRLAESAEAGINLIGPVAQENGPCEFKLSDFTVDVEQQQATCPGGQAAALWTVSRRSDGTLAFTAHFGRQCATCLLRPRCTTAAQGRTITIHEHHDLVVARREEMETAEFWQKMKRRPPIEGTISQVMRQGARRAQYRGQRKVNLQLIFTAVAVNLKRLLCAWAQGRKPRWQTAAAG
jgi:transposase